VKCGRTSLAVQSRKEVATRLRERIRAGEQILERHPESEKDFEAYRSDTMRWWSYNDTFLHHIFVGNSIADDFAAMIPISVKTNWEHCSFFDLKDVVSSQINKFHALLEQLDLFAEVGILEEAAALHDRSKVFVVHGHDEGALQAVARFLETIDLTAIVLREQPDQGRTIIEKFEACARRVGFAVVLLTPDDLGGAASSPGQSARARQNVIFELGYFVGSLGRGRACLLRKGNIEIPSDLVGVIYSDFDHPAEGWKVKLARELKAAEFVFDSAKVLA
jgi:predicted nucleotide-binding protein